jgi:hypothetical protein
LNTFRFPLLFYAPLFFSLICIFFPLEVSSNHYRSHCIYFSFRHLSPAFIHTPASTLFHHISPAFISSDLTAYFHSIPCLFSLLFSSFFTFVCHANSLRSTNVCLVAIFLPSPQARLRGYKGRPVKLSLHWCYCLPTTLRPQPQRNLRCLYHLRVCEGYMMHEKVGDVNGKKLKK